MHRFVGSFGYYKEAPTKALHASVIMFKVATLTCSLGRCMNHKLISQWKKHILVSSTLDAT